MEQLKTATPDQEPDLLRQRKRVKSQMNLYGPAAVAKWMRQEFPEIDEADRHEEVGASGKLNGLMTTQWRGSCSHYVCATFLITSWI
jgi:hypothetical protein